MRTTVGGQVEKRGDLGHPERTMTDPHHPLGFDVEAVQWSVCGADQGRQGQAVAGR